MLTLTLAGTLDASPNTVSVAEKLARAVGRKSIEIVQVRPGASGTPTHAVEGCTVNAADPVPVTSALVGVNGMDPVFFTVTEPVLVVFTVTLPNFTEFGVTEKVDATPVPVRETLAGLPAALWVNDSDALRRPAAVGVILTEMVQEAPGTSVPVQSVVLV